MNSQKPQIIKRLGKGNFIIGCFFVAAGLTFIGLAFFKNFTLSFHKILLPQWVLYVVAFIAVLFGSYGIYSAFQTYQCSMCKIPLSYGEAFYPSAFESQVRKTVENLNPEELRNIPKYNREREWVQLTLDFCCQCNEIGCLSLVGVNKKREKRLIVPPKLVVKNTILSFEPYLKASNRIDPLKLDGIKG